MRLELVRFRIYREKGEFEGDVVEGKKLRASERLRGN